MSSITPLVCPLLRIQGDWDQSIRNALQGSQRPLSSSAAPAAASSSDIGLEEYRQEQQELDRLRDKVNFDTFWVQLDIPIGDKTSSSIDKYYGEFRAKKGNQQNQPVVLEEGAAANVLDHNGQRRTLPRSKDASYAPFFVHRLQTNISGKGDSEDDRGYHVEIGTHLIDDSDNSRKSIFAFRSPSGTYRNIHSAAKNRSVECIDVSQGGVVGISGSADGQVRVWDAQTGALKRDLVGHIGDIYVARVLPSAQVGMTSGSDTMIKIWRLSDGLCAVTLSGQHNAAVTSLDFVDRGRNFISSSKDGSVRLWDCASQSCITTLLDVRNTFMNQCCVAQQTTGAPAASAAAALDSRDFGTEGKIAIAVTQHGMLYGVDIRSRKQTVHKQVTGDRSALNCCHCSDDLTIVLGSENGHIYTYDMRQPDQPLHVWMSNCSAPSPVLSLSGYSANQIAFSTTDGTCALYNYRQKNCSALEIQFTGPDYEPVYGTAVATGTSCLYTACRDGAIRKYALAALAQ